MSIKGSKFHRQQMLVKQKCCCLLVVDGLWHRLNPVWHCRKWDKMVNFKTGGRIFNGFNDEKRDIRKFKKCTLMGVQV